MDINYYDKGDIVVNTDYENIYASGSVKLAGKAINVPSGNAGNRGAGIVAGGDISLLARENISIDSSITSNAGNILAVAGGKFINNTTNNTGLVANAGHYYVYSSTTIDTVEGMTGYNKHYNQTYTAGLTPSYAANGNWFFYSIAPLLDVTPGSSQRVVYGTAPNAVTPSYTGFIDGDTAETASISGTALFNIGGIKSTSNNYIVGTHDVSYTGGLLSSLGYQFRDKAASSNELTVTAKVISTSGAAAQSKVYDAGTTAIISGETLNGVLSNDVVTVSGGGSFADKNAGTGKNVVAALTLGGTDAGNYQLTQPTGLTADITKKALNVEIIGTISKVYDGKTSAILTAGNYSLSGIVSGDTVILSNLTNGMYDSPDTGISKTVSVSGLSLSGIDAGNYQLPSAVPSGTVGIITPANQTATTAMPVSQDNNPHVQVIQGGVNGVSGGTVPTSISVTKASGTQATSSNYALVVTGDSLTVKAVGTGNSGNDIVATNSTIALVSVDTAGGQTSTSSSYYNMASSSGSVTLSAGTAATTGIPKEPSTNAASATYSMPTASGAVAEFRVSYENGAISIQPLNDAAKEMTTDSGNGKKLVAATGLLTAQENLGANIQAVTAIYVHN